MTNFTIPKTVIMLGSGWNKILDSVKIIKEYSYKDIFGLETSVPGHKGSLIIASIKNKKVAFMSGRIHLYEGIAPEIATQPIRILAKAGMKNLIVTSASGAINEKYQVGDFIILSDLLTLLLAGKNPLIGPEFVDMSEVFDLTMKQKAIKACAKNDIPFHEGVYAYCHGPHFETPADKMALKILGADVVGMSMVPETIVAKSLGIKVLGLSYVTNLAFVKHEHKDVLKAAQKGSKQMSILLSNLLS